jgi:hypothetical protein
MVINKRIPDFTNLALFNYSRRFMISSKPKQSLFVFHTSTKISLMSLFLPLPKYIVTQRYSSVYFNLCFMKYEHPFRKNDFNQSHFFVCIISPSFHSIFCCLSFNTGEMCVENVELNSPETSYSIDLIVMICGESRIDPDFNTS